VSLENLLISGWDLRFDNFFNYPSYFEHIPDIGGISMRTDKWIVVLTALMALSIAIVSFAGARADLAAAPHVTLNSITVWVNQTRMTVHNGDTIDVSEHDIVVVQPKATYHGPSGTWGSLEVESIPSDGTLTATTVQVKMLKPGVTTAMQFNDPIFTGPASNDYFNSVNIYGGTPGTKGTHMAYLIVNVHVSG
jgi:hypothetical protein